MNIFIDGFKLLRIESDEYIHDIKMKDHKISWQKNDGNSQFFTTKEDIKLHLDDVIEINGKTYPLQIGIVTLTPEFEKRFRYDGPLGAIYDKDHTDFYLFSPVAKQVFVEIEEKRYEMTYQEPIWHVKVEGDLHNKLYIYDIKLVDEFKKVKDPYTKAASSNGSHVFDFNQSIKLDKTPIKVKNYVDAVIYEGHVRDMSIALDVKHKGLFEGLLED